MASKSSDWQPGPSVCRCCLGEGCYKDISTEYFWMGKREVYAEMLTQTLDLEIAFSQNKGPNSNSRLICESCISRLRDATEFKRQVQECEKTFMQHLDIEKDPDPIYDTEEQKDVKLECVKEEQLLSDDDDDRYVPPDFPDDDDDDLDDEPLTKLVRKVPKKESIDMIEEFLDEDDDEKPVVVLKRKSTTKNKASSAKKSKVAKKTSDTATASKAKPEKKKKGPQPKRTETDNESETNNPLVDGIKEKPKYQRSARSEARMLTKENANSILKCWTVIPFRWKRNKFKCSYCDENFTECHLLRDHVRLCSTVHHFKDIYSKFKEMTLINIDVTESYCKICSARFRNTENMLEHVVSHGFSLDPKHPSGVIPFYLNKESWQCIECRCEFNNFLKLYEHMNTHYQHYICSSCGKGFMTSQRLRKHSELHISGYFPCQECGKIFNMRVARDYHKANVHQKEPRYKCPQCDLRFRGYYARMQHLKEAHREKEVSYKCSHCDLHFKTSGRRGFHIRTVHFPPQRNFACPHCEWHFKTSYELKRHVVKHTGEKNFHCTLCGKAFLRNKALKTHLKTHETFPIVNS